MGASVRGRHTSGGPDAARAAAPRLGVGNRRLACAVGLRTRRWNRALSSRPVRAARAARPRRRRDRASPDGGAAGDRRWPTSHASAGAARHAAAASPAAANADLGVLGSAVTRLRSLVEWRLPSRRSFASRGAGARGRKRRALRAAAASGGSAAPVRGFASPFSHRAAASFGAVRGRRGVLVAECRRRRPRRSTSAPKMRRYVPHVARTAEAMPRHASNDRAGDAADGGWKMRLDSRRLSATSMRRFDAALRGAASALTCAGLRVASGDNRRPPPMHRVAGRPSADSRSRRVSATPRPGEVSSADRTYVGAERARGIFDPAEVGMGGDENRAPIGAAINDLPSAEFREMRPRSVQRQIADLVEERQRASRTGAAATPILRGARPSHGRRSGSRAPSSRDGVRQARAERLRHAGRRVLDRPRERRSWGISRVAPLGSSAAFRGGGGDAGGSGGSGNRGASAIAADSPSARARSGRDRTRPAAGAPRRRRRARATARRCEVVRLVVGGSAARRSRMSDWREVGPAAARGFAAGRRGFRRPQLPRTRPALRRVASRLGSAGHLLTAVATWRTRAPPDTARLPSRRAKSRRVGIVAATAFVGTRLARRAPRVAAARRGTFAVVKPVRRCDTLERAVSRRHSAGRRPRRTTRALRRAPDEARPRAAAVAGGLDLAHEGNLERAQVALLARGALALNERRDVDSRTRDETSCSRTHRQSRAYESCARTPRNSASLQLIRPAPPREWTSAVRGRQVGLSDESPAHTGAISTEPRPRARPRAAARRRGDALRPTTPAARHQPHVKAAALPTPPSRRRGCVGVVDKPAVARRRP